MEDYSVTINKEEIKKHIRLNYGKIASQGVQGCGACCSSNEYQKTDLFDIVKTSNQLGYTSNDLVGMPENANMGLGCGNPVAIASIKKGETVLDLGSGGGFDCFLARKQTGESGFIIGVDMTPEMIELSTRNAEQLGYTNIEFRLGDIEDLPIEDASIDVIISNCVINLSQDKGKVFKEAYRVLRKGGRLSITDVLATAELPDNIKNDLSMISGCISGAEYTQTVFNMLKQSGFDNIRMIPKDNSKEILRSWKPGKHIEDYVASFIIEAKKT